MEQVLNIEVRHILVFARISMLWGFGAAILSIVIGYGMVKVGKHGPKLETFVNIISLVCCVIPNVIIIFLAIGREWVVPVNCYLLRWGVLAALGWRLPYILIRKGADNVIGILCLSMARIIAVYAGVTFVWWVLNVYFVILNVSYLMIETWGVLVKMIICVCLLNLGKYFLHPISTKEVLIDML